MQVGDLVKHKDGMKDLGLVVDCHPAHGLYRVRWFVVSVDYYQNSTGTYPAKNLELICK